MDKLTRKQQGFVKDYIETGNGTQSVMNNYDVKDETVASSISTENLRKPYIAEVIAEALSDDLLLTNHKKLFDQRQVSYFVFPKSMEDEEIVAHVNANGIDVITVRESDKGKMAFYSIPDAQAIKAGLDMGYKLKGSYAPDKAINLNIDTEITNPEARALAKEYEEKLKKSL